MNTLMKALQVYHFAIVILISYFFFNFGISIKCTH